jgi:hypothetical protein
MKGADLIAALKLPAGARVDQRVPKKLLLERAPTAADKRRITDGIDEVHWIAALKPTTVGVPLYRDDAREYLEIAVLSTGLRTEGNASRLVELIHRAIPYPVVLVAEQGERLSLSLAHKRWSQGEAAATVLDGEVVSVDIAAIANGDSVQAFRSALALTCQPRAHLFALYQGWMDALIALLAARLTGVFKPAESPAKAAARQRALCEYARLDAEITRLRAAAAKERQVARQVELNLELKRVERERAAALEKL